MPGSLGIDRWTPGDKNREVSAPPLGSVGCRRGFARRRLQRRRQRQRAPDLGNDDHDAVQPRRPDQRRLGAGRGEVPPGFVLAGHASRSIATAPTSPRRSPRTPSGRIIGLVTGLKNGTNTINATHDRRQLRRRAARHHQPSDRRAGAARLADDAVDLRDAGAGRRRSATRRRRTPAACRRPRSTRSATSRPNSSSCIAP